MSLEIGHKRTLTLQGVGYKATVLPDANTLAIKVSSVPPFLFKIPNDISIKLEKQSIIC
jgi:ribosomal protein L6P/L9E